MYILSLLTSTVIVCLSEARLMTDSVIQNAQQNLTQPQISNLTTYQHTPSLSTQVSRKVRSIRSLKVSDISCDATPSTCNLTASAYNSTQQWKKFCFFGDSRLVRACSEICTPGNGDYHRIRCRLKCRGYIRTCSQETTKPPLDTNWVFSPMCNTTTEQCQMKGLNHTKFYNISCYGYELIDKTIMKSCFETCRSNRTEDQIECRQSCKAFNASCLPPETKTTENNAKIRKRDNILRNGENTETEEHSLPIGFAILIAICIALPLAVIIGATVLVCRREQRNRVNDADDTQNTSDAQGNSEMELLNCSP